jgi:alpha-aminoadipate carrier protein LysW
LSFGGATTYCAAWYNKILKPYKTALATGGSNRFRLRRVEMEERNQMVNCPLCDAAIDVDEEELDEGDVLICEECGTNLTVSSVTPLELVAEEDDAVDDEDDDDFDDDFDEDEEDEEEEDDDED